MTKLVYFLGAGAAHPCGYPTTPGLYQSIYNERQDLALFQKFGGPLSDVTNAEPIDIEILYDLVSQEVGELANSMYGRFGTGFVGDQLLAKILQTNSQWGDTLAELSQAFEECHEAILEFIREKFWRVKPDLSPYEKLQIQPATWDLGPRNIVVVTTNYDTSLEDFFDDIIPFNCGIAGGAFSMSELTHGDPDKVRLLKLHGSVDLYRVSSGNIVHVNSFRKPGHWKGEEDIVGPYLVPPQIGKIEYDETQLSLFEYFRILIKDADAVAIIGTSFRDRKVNSVLKSAPMETDILIACGSNSETFAKTHFEEHQNVTPITSHFPDPKIEEWIHLQIRGLEIDEKGNLTPKNRRNGEPTS